MRARQAIVISIALLLLGALACAQNGKTGQTRNDVPAATSKPAEVPQSTHNWEGRYEAISECDGPLLTIGAGTFSYGKCANVPIQTVAETENEFSFRVGAGDHCSWSTWILSLKSSSPPSKDHYDFLAYENDKNFHSGTWTISCSFRRQPTSKH
ncbi:MAG TPA: hypothetical protein VE377_03480 [Candidatus Dormibacteraeota bacterium]|nr:hypothetical protein [Candidatus Dormibacteraeota bacterium]